MRLIHCSTQQPVTGCGEEQFLTTLSNRKAQLRWHTDAEPLHFDRADLDHTFYAILSWSFGASRSFLVKHKKSGVIDRVVLSSGDVIAMNQNFQFQYLHWCAMYSFKVYV